MTPNTVSPASSDTVLLIGVEPAGWPINREILEVLGYSVLVAGDNQQALALFLENRRQIDLVILDVVLPELGGLQIIRQLRLLDPEVTIVMVTGSSWAGAEAAVLAGADAVIRKPYQVSELDFVIRRFIERGAPLKAVSA